VLKVYAYGLMITHSHLIIDANGADISKVFEDLRIELKNIF
jgi:hypothetical protein